MSHFLGCHTLERLIHFANIGIIPESSKQIGLYFQLPMTPHLTMDDDTDMEMTADSG